MSVAENFQENIPTLNRKDLMSLSTINSKDEKIRPFKKMDTQRDWSINWYNQDIEASAPKRFGIFTNKVDFINKVDDIERTNPKIWHYPLNKPEYNLSNSDIDRSSPNMGNLRTTRCTNPLEPKYHLAKVEELPLPEPRFIRDAIDIKDIQGAIPKKYFKWETRETFPMDNHGIPGTKPKKTYVRNTIYHNIDYSDLTKDIFKTGRQTNPLDPIYDFKRKNGEIWKYGFIEKSKPQTIYPYTYPDPFILKVNDIKGTNAGSKNRINHFNGNNYEMTTKDIRGASAGSLKKGIVTQRKTNPLNPKYQFLGGVELKGVNYDPFAMKVISMKKTSTPQIEERKAISAKPEAVKKQFHEEEKGDNGSQPNNEIGFNHHWYSEEKINFNKDNYKQPDPYYGLIHDKYVCPSEFPDVRNRIEKEKTEKIVATTTNNWLYGTTSLNNMNMTGTGFKASKTDNLNNSNNNATGNISVNKLMSKTATSGFGKGITYAQKWDQFMDTNKLKYIGLSDKKAKQPKMMESVPE